jgi:hypothetical protein
MLFTLLLLNGTLSIKKLLGGAPPDTPIVVAPLGIHGSLCLWYVEVRVVTKPIFEPVLEIPSSQKIKILLFRMTDKKLE